MKRIPLLAATLLFSFQLFAQDDPSLTIPSNVDPIMMEVRFGPFVQEKVRLKITNEGLISWNNVDANGQETFQKHIARIGTGMMGNLKTILNTETLGMRTQIQQLEGVVIFPGIGAVTGQEPQYTLNVGSAQGYSMVLLTTFVDGSTSYVHDQILDTYNGTKYLSPLGYDYLNILEYLKATFQLATKR